MIKNILFLTKKQDAQSDNVLKYIQYMNHKITVFEDADTFEDFIHSGQKVDLILYDTFHTARLSQITFPVNQNEKFSLIV